MVTVGIDWNMTGRVGCHGRRRHGLGKVDV